MLRIAAVVMTALAASTLAACEAVGTQQGYEPEQPIAFSHALHAGDYQISCLYCHGGAERSRHAGVPAASVCMNCHSKVLPDSPEIKKIATAIETNTPIEWVKVHRLPDFAWFDHSRHVNAGVQCQSCHGAVEQMVRVKQEQTMTMGWCLSCHRATANDPANAGILAPPSDCAACHY
jgi:hypothetical protein